MRLLGLALVGCSLLIPSVAFAQNDTDPNYEYRFEDDPLAGISRDDVSALIRIRIGVPRTTLIRPRTHFVPELLKSVEHL